MRSKIKVFGPTKVQILVKCYISKLANGKFWLFEMAEHTNVFCGGFFNAVGKTQEAI